MYQKIENRVSVPDIYANSLVMRGVVTQDELMKDAADYTVLLNEELKLSDSAVPHTSHLDAHWKGLVQASEDKITIWDTGICTVILFHFCNREPNISSSTSAKIELL